MKIYIIWLIGVILWNFMEFWFP